MLMTRYHYIFSLMTTRLFEIDSYLFYDVDFNHETINELLPLALILVLSKAY
ncbi:hypothetical protein SAMN05421690_102631 [Nitrosomonas sp. Nm51]|uniref:hypothetical protein n=1 Tax=Nitrosomonas sp. Nm51 TaxID=133720 RepID=UPI0008C9098A|nr:hypothetical protein [Nitrosomonas sp. Nm51]SER43311.1 hypothetical protein SAMN05421690_102631 [Nitrosomonas sp. Nm51]